MRPLPDDIVRTLMSAQALVTAFLAVFLWSLHARMRQREFIRWWAWAWTFTTLHLAAGRIAIELGRAWSAPKVIVVVLTTISGFLVIPSLIFGALSFRSPGTITRRIARNWLVAVVLFASLSVAISLIWSHDRLTSFAVRNGTRELGLTLALFVSAWVFIQRGRATRSWATLVTGASCLTYGMNQMLYTVVRLGDLARAATGASPRDAGWSFITSGVLPYLDIALTCGMCLGVGLLLVEEYQRSSRELVESTNRRREVVQENTTLQSEIERRKELERRLREAEDRYVDLVEHSEDLVCTHDLDGRLLTCSPAPARLLGYEVHEMLTRSVSDFLAPEFRDQFAAYIEAVRRDGVAAGLVMMVTREGERRQWAFRCTLLNDNEAAPIVRGLGRDVTEQRTAEHALRLSEERFTIAFQSSPCAMAIVALDEGRFLDVNNAFESQTGFSRSEVFGRNTLDAGIWSDPAERDAVRNALLTEGRLKAREMRFRLKNGDVATVIFSAEVVQMGDVRCALLAGIDVTARKVVEARHQAILQALPDWVFLTTDGGVFLECHAKDQRHLVLPPREFIGRHVSEVLPPDLATRLLACFDEAFRSNDPVTIEYSLWLGDEHRFYEVRSVRCADKQVLSLVRDVTNQRRAEHRAHELQLETAHAGRVMALGTLTGSLAHEINQPLAAIQANAHAARRLLESAVPDIAQVRAALGDIMADNRRIADVLQRLRGLLRKERNEYAPVDINAIVDDVLKLAHSNFIERRISIDVSLASDLPSILGDRVQLQQVVLNILMNAADAVGSAPNLDDRQVRVTTTVTDSQVRVSVADRGDCAPELDVDRMFDPFFTTKRDGMGLGLSICRVIMDAHGGHIAAQRNADRGLTCSFALRALSIPAATMPVEVA